MNNWAKKIGFSADCIQTVTDYPFPDSLFSEYKKLFWTDIEECYQHLLELPDSPFYILSFYLRIAYEYQFGEGAETKVVREGFYENGCRDIWLWACDCYRRHGFYGIADSHHWFLGKILDTTVVRIGRLEFETGNLEQEIDAFGEHFSKGKRVINVHIPAGESLSPEACREAYQGAAVYFSMEQPVFICESWLMSPVLEKLLPEKANINCFRKEYQVYELLEEDRQFEERVFEGVLLEQPDGYPEKTSLQRKAKEILKNNGKLPSAKGIKKGV